VIILARLTVGELIRRRVVWVLAILSIVSVALVGWGLERLVSIARAEAVEEAQIAIGVSQILILIAFMFSFVLAMTAAFVGAPAIGGDLESGVALAILARPIRRAEVMVGRWLGCAIVVVAYTVLSGLLAIGVAVLVSGYGPPEPFLAVAFLAGQALVLLTLTLALGSVLPSIAAGAIAVVGFGLGWMAGVMAGIAAALGVDLLGRVAEASRWIFPSDAPDLAKANPFYAPAPPSLIFVVWSVVWIVLVLGLAAWRFERRDL
jgi:ABC-type transport system involved in multi-copper enzyme maturation permease subunit